MAIQILKLESSLLVTERLSEYEEQTLYLLSEVIGIRYFYLIGLCISYRNKAFKVLILEN
jgi:hypothetical protein